MQVPASSPLRLKSASGGKLWCDNEDSYDNNCRFQQIDSEMTPVVMKATVLGNPDNKIRFEGSNFS
jgi:hypothetical protein